MIYSPYEKEIWDYLVSKIGNEIGVAALMGNLYAESSLIYGRLQSDFTATYAPSKSFTQALNTGDISQYDFVTTKYYTYNGTTYGPAYGLAQWDYSPRRQNYWNLFHQWDMQAGSAQFELAFVWWELNNDYRSVLTALQNATSIRAASDVVLARYENPADQSEGVKQTRATYGTNIYNEYAGSPIDPDPPSPDPSYPTISAPWAAVLYYITRRRNNVFYARSKRGFKK